jgi:hypothetical protein
MKRAGFVVLLLLGLVMGRAEAEEGKTLARSQGALSPETTVVEIDYGGVKEPRKVEVPLVRGKTALAVLQSMAVVKTRPVGPYIFVVAIDEVEGRRGETAWYYEVDGKSPGELAYTKVLEGTKRIRWMYKKDVCSAKVEEKPGKTQERGDRTGP